MDLSRREWLITAGAFAISVPNFALTSSGAWVLPLQGDRQPFLFLQTEFNEYDAQFSPNGKWIAYTSDESGADQVYVQSFPASGAKWQGLDSGWNGSPVAA